jgi:hypothetical protein
LVADVCGGKHDQIPEIALFDLYENTLSKTPTDIVKQFKLKNCYQELLTLRLQVRRAERLSGERFSKRSLVAILLKENQIPARDRNNCLKSDVHNGLPLASGRMFSWQPDPHSFIKVRADFMVVGNEIAVADLSMGLQNLARLSKHL